MMTVRRPPVVNRAERLESETGLDPCLNEMSPARDAQVGNSQACGVVDRPDVSGPGANPTCQPRQL